ncbi:MAG: glycosyltransferase family 2 protein [Bergeyella sp.]
MKKVAAVIVTFNGEKWIERCINSIKNSDYTLKIFVIDNASTDNTLEIVKKFDVELIQSKENTGFGFANNLLLKEALEAGFDYFFLINQDLYVEKETLQQLIDFSEKHPESGIIAPIQFDGKGEKIDQNFRQYIRLSEDKGDFYETSFANAGAWLVTKECLEKTGFFSPHFPHYGEDRNFCERALFHGFTISIPKNTRVLHDREQNMSLDKAVKLGKIKLLTIFLNPNLSQSESISQGLKNAFGISKFIFKKHKSIKAFPELLKEYFKLFRKKNYWENEKIKQK